jgi:hypothetical protein
MRIRLMLSLVTVGLMAAPAVAADDAKAVIEKAIKAHGGEENLTKYKASKIKAKGTLSIMGMDIDFSVEASSQLPDQFREEVKLDVMGNEVTIIQVFDGKKGWVSQMGNTMEVDGTQLKQLKDQAYGNYIETLVPLIKDKQFELTSLDETKVEGKLVNGVKITAKDHKDVKMYFDKESGLLLKSEHKTMDPTMQEVESETYYRDYKDVSGLKQSFKQTVKHDGKKFLEAQVTEIKVLEKLDSSTFNKP